MRMLRMAVPSVGLLVLMFAQQNELGLRIGYGILLLSALIYLFSFFFGRFTGARSTSSD